jgi:hypothetical protein
MVVASGKGHHKMLQQYTKKKRKKREGERDPHAYLLRLVEAVLIVKGEGGVVSVITERKEMQCSFSRKNCKR